MFETREKNYIYYGLNTSVVEEVMLWLSQLKEEFDIQLPQNEGESLYTVEEFSEYVRNKI